MFVEIYSLRYGASSRYMNELLIKDMVSERFAKGLEMKSYISIRFNDESLNRHPFYQKGHDTHSIQTDTYIYT